MQKHSYETAFILTPILSDQQAKDAVAKFRQILEAQGADIINLEEWGLKKLAYPINRKSTGFYALVEFNAAPSVVATLETEYRRDERIIRFLTIKLDKHAIAYNEKRRRGEFNRKPAEIEPVPGVVAEKTVTEEA